MSPPLVSVITPAYNHGRYIGRAIDSILGQTYPNWELIIVDDGSTDNTAEVVKAYDDSRITYVYQENQGVRKLAGTINKGLWKSKGEFVTMFGSDDTWPPYRLETEVPLFEDPAVVLVYGRGFLIDQNDEVIGEVARPSESVNIENRPVGSALHEMFLSNYVFQPSVLVRRAALDRLGGYLQPEGLLAEDYPTHMALALQGEFRYLDRPLANYRMHAAQMTRNHYLEMAETDVPFVLEFFRGLDPQSQRITGWTEAELADALARRLNNTYFEVGRRELLAGNWKEARRHFLTALRRGDSRTKVKAVAGISCSFLRTDLERAARAAGRARLR